jgi:hypothetical protein
MDDTEVNGIHEILKKLNYATADNLSNGLDPGSVSGNGPRLITLIIQFGLLRG